MSVTWSEAALLQNGGRNKKRLLGVCQKLVCVPAGLRIACIGVNVSQLPICGCQLHQEKVLFQGALHILNLMSA